MYDRRYSVGLAQHAVVRNRALAAAALGYGVEGEADYGVEAPAARFDWLPGQTYVVFLTATSRDDKLWPEAHWTVLGRQLHALGYCAVLRARNAMERERANRLATMIPGAVAAPPLSITELASLLAGSRAAVGVDTGLGHLAVAVRVPTVAVYVSTDPGLTGVLGSGYHRNLGGRSQMPAPEAVLAALQPALA